MKPKLIEVQTPFGLTLRVNRHPFRRWHRRAAGYFATSRNPRILGHIHYLEMDHEVLVHEIVHAAFEAVRRGAVANGSLEESVATAAGQIYAAAAAQPELWK